MASINLLTGTAHGKVGVLQYQSQGLKCIVRSKQPDGLTNPQAEQVNKPILLALSEQYRLWAKWLLDNYQTDYKRPQALWNYYTKCNQDVYTKEVGYSIGFQVNKHHIAQEYYPVYSFTGPRNPGRLYFPVSPDAYPPGSNIVIVHGYKTRPWPEVDLIELPLSAEILNLPTWELEAPYDDIAVFLKERDASRAVTGFTPVTYINEEAAPFWEVPQGFLDSGVSLTSTGLESAVRAHSLTIDIDAVPAEYQYLPMRLTFHQACGSYAQGQIADLPLAALVDLGTDDKVFNPDEQVITWELYSPRFNIPASTPANALPSFTPIAFTPEEKQTAVTAINKALLDNKGDVYITLSVPGPYLATGKITAALAPAGALATAIGAATRHYDSNGEKTVLNANWAALSGTIGTVTLLDSRTMYPLSEALPVNPQEWYMYDWSDIENFSSWCEWMYNPAASCYIGLFFYLPEYLWNTPMPVKARTILSSSGFPLDSLTTITPDQTYIEHRFNFPEGYPPFLKNETPFEVYFFDEDQTHIHSTPLTVPVEDIGEYHESYYDKYNCVALNWETPYDAINFDISFGFNGRIPLSFPMQGNITWTPEFLSYYPNAPTVITGQSLITIPYNDDPYDENDLIGRIDVYINNKLYFPQAKVYYTAV
jgi:hypothetical protein